VLTSERAVQVNIEIMRAFIRLRQAVSTHQDLAHKFAALENKYDWPFKVVFDAIRSLMKEPEPKRRGIGLTARRIGIADEIPTYSAAAKYAGRPSGAAPQHPIRGMQLALGYGRRFLLTPIFFAVSVSPANDVPVPTYGSGPGISLMPFSLPVKVLPSSETVTT
jgi:hypothetical protein